MCAAQTGRRVPLPRGVDLQPKGRWGSSGRTGRRVPEARQAGANSSLRCGAAGPIRVLARGRSWRRAATCCLLILLAGGFWGRSAAEAMRLTGVLLQAVDLAGRPLGPVWHTARGGGRPLGFTRFPPPAVRGIPFGNAKDGEISIPLLHGTHLTTLFWQFLPGEFPPAMVLNLYFDEDSTSPKISAFVPLQWGLTNFVFNSAPGLLSLFLEEVPNEAELYFDSGLEQARLGAAFYFSSDPRWQGQWRPSDYVNLDRVGVDRLAPDGQPDGIFIFELIVEPSPARARRKRPFVGLFPRGSLDLPLPAPPRQPPLAFESGQARAPEVAPSARAGRSPIAESIGWPATPSASTPAATRTAWNEPDETASPRPTPSPPATGTAKRAATPTPPTTTPPPTARPEGTAAGDGSGGMSEGKSASEERGAARLP